MNSLRVAITGATGLLGRNLLFEIVKQRLTHLDRLEILILGPANVHGSSLQARMEEILRSDGADYVGICQDSRERFVANVSRIVKYVDFDCGRGPLEIALPEQTDIESKPIDWFFHVAGHMDLRASPAAIATLRAYACGSAAGTIQPDCVNSTGGFRNPYERSKLDAEVLVRQFARSNGVRCRYFRPSTICGRLMEPPWGAISKFDVFHAWAAFFLRCKLAKAATPAGGDGCDLDARVAYRRDGGLNIVPVDYRKGDVCALRATSCGREQSPGMKQ